MTTIYELPDASSLICLARDDAACIASLGIPLNQAMIRERIGILCTQIDTYLPSLQWQDIANDIVEAYEDIIKYQGLYGVSEYANQVNSKGFTDELTLV